MAVAEIREMAKGLACEFCKAQPHARCVTVKGTPAKEQHDARSNLLREAWEMGYSDGREDMLDDLADKMPWATTALAKRRAQRA